MSALFREMDDGTTAEAKLCRALDKMEALIQHNESPLSTWSENEYSLNRTYAFDAAAFDPWLTELRREILAGGTAEEMTGRLMDRALAQGAPDNVTVVLFQLA